VSLVLLALLLVLAALVLLYPRTYAEWEASVVAKHVYSSCMQASKIANPSADPLELRRKCLEIANSVYEALRNERKKK
jgi:hypothetical protein